MKKWIVGVAALVLLGVVGWYVAAPWMAMNGLRDAVVAGDSDAIEARVDFESVRTEMKADLRARMQAELASETGSGGEKLGAALGMVVIDGMVDNIVTPEVIGSVVREGQARSGLIEAAPAGDAAQEPIDWRIERDGLSRFRAIPETDDIDAETAPRLVFEREGFSWKLVEIVIPELEQM